jgi:hypothetical protein
MNDNELKESLESIRHRAIRTQLSLNKFDVKTAILKRKSVIDISKELTSISIDLAEIEDAFDENIHIPQQINEVSIRAAQLSILFGLRRATSNTLRDAMATLSQLRADINFYRSLSVAMVALFCSVIGLILNVV